MKAFKTFIASAIAGVMVLSMATSAFAAVTVDTNSVVSATDVESVNGQRTVLVVTESSWSEASGLVANPEILYINQVDNGILETTLEAMAGKDLTHGDYRVLVGNENGTVAAQNFTAIKVAKVEDPDALRGETILDVEAGETAVYWNVTMNSGLVKEIVAGNVKAKFYATDLLDYVGEETVLEWENAEVTFTGSGDFTFTAETVVSEDYVETTQLEVSAGSVSNKN